MVKNNKNGEAENLNNRVGNYIPAKAGLKKLNMKKVNFGLIAAAVGLIFALGSQEVASRNLDQEYARLSDGSWILVTPATEEQYACEPSSEICKATFPQDPNQSTSGMVITSDNGVYTLQ